ncbi:hypothetical protein BDV96DRAFT_549645 [Lophiotrema nucula]|uniref:PH domain-containing protein n=1 Tax=Lophiotrema nucula TaxID=690887 RepID=A0A6A5Z1L1_9PLEO|nr:hypothetical protein BDV96DRAFT_549645 [Lophiotrema nucula]
MAENVPRTPSKPINIRPTGMKIEPPLVQPRVEAIRASQANVNVMSPVNQNGSFEFDRVIKEGTVVKRTRKTKSWKPIYLVLRPNLLSIYKNKNETKLRHQITLSDITAVARQKDAKKKVDHVFGIFSPARNYHLGAPNEKDAQEWVDLIRTEARIGEDEEEMVVLSPTGTKNTFSGFGKILKRDNVGSSSSEAEQRPSSSAPREQMHSARRPSHTLTYSGNERGSFSDFSDTGGVQAAFQDSLQSLPPNPQQQDRNTSQVSNVGATPDDERVIYHGWLYVLKAKGGIRQWKKVWVVLRPKALGIYKNGEEYSANLIIPFSNIIDAVEIDPVSKTKQYCMQIISEEKNLRFCASNDDILAKWLGAFKSLLVKRKEADHQRVLAAGANPGNVQPPAQPKPSSTSAPQKAVDFAPTEKSTPPSAVATK